MLLNAHVEEVLVEGGRATGVRLRGGSTVSARKAVVSNASLWDTQRLLPSRVITPKMQKEAQARLRRDAGFGCWPRQCPAGEACARSCNSSRLRPNKQGRRLHQPGRMLWLTKSRCLQETPLNRSFMHLHLGFDATGLEDLELHHIIVNSWEGGVDTEQACACQAESMFTTMFTIIFSGACLADTFKGLLQRPMLCSHPSGGVNPR